MTFNYMSFLHHKKSKRPMPTKKNIQKEISHYRGSYILCILIPDALLKQLTDS